MTSHIIRNLHTPQPLSRRTDFAIETTNQVERFQETRILHDIGPHQGAQSKPMDKDQARKETVPRDLCAYLRAVFRSDDLVCDDRSGEIGGGHWREIRQRFEDGVVN